MASTPDAFNRDPLMKADPERLQRIGQLAKRYIDDDRFAGIAWRVDHDGATVSEGALGHRDHARDQPLADDTIYRIYSMTKPMVSVVALQLIEEGRLRLYDPVSRFVSAFGDCQVLDKQGNAEPLQRPVIIEDLLTHRSGLSYDFLPGCAAADACRANNAALNGQRSLADLVELLASLPLVAQPGSRWTYSFSTDVLAHVLEKVLDKSLSELMHERLFSPLGLSDTAYSLDADKLPRLMDMFGQRDLNEPILINGAPQRVNPMDVSESYPTDKPDNFARGGHGLYSTISDYQCFIGVLQNGQAPDGRAILSAPMVDMMWQNRVGGRQRPLAIGPIPMPGYGWNLFGRVMLEPGQAMKLTAEGEGGWAGAASTFFWVDRRHRFSGIVMSQFLGASIPLGDEMQTAAYQALLSV